MKAVTTILYLCGGLMAAAAVMGAIDYNVAAHKGSLKKLYKEEEQPLPIVKKTVDIENYSRARIDMPEEKPQAKEVAKKEKPVAKPIAVKYEPVVEDEQEQAEENKTYRKRKAIRFSEFSRGPLPRKNYEGKKTVKATVDTAENKAWDN
jgi:type IV secretory pathway VirB10-like protein